MSQCTSPAPPGAPVGLEVGLPDGLAVALELTMGCAVGRGEVLLDDGEMLHAENATAIATNAGPKRTR